MKIQFRMMLTMMMRAVFHIHILQYNMRKEQKKDNIKMQRLKKYSQMEMSFPEISDFKMAINKLID